MPSIYFLGGIMLMGFFAVLSETNINNRFEDHYLTIFQIGANIALQLGFLLAAPEIGGAFLSFLFLAFGFGALRMTSGRAMIAWGLTTVGVIPAILFAAAPIGMPLNTPPNFWPRCSASSSRSDNARSWVTTAAAANHAL
jgi:hypothetical protein